MEFEINGIKYTQRETEQRKPMNSKMSLIITMAQLFISLDPRMQPAKVQPTYSHDTLIKEYELIQNKKSNLSRSQRDYIVWRFERTFKRID